jgi:hypothetical protein
VVQDSAAPESSPVKAVTDRLQTVDSFQELDFLRNYTVAEVPLDSSNGIKQPNSLLAFILQPYR